MRVLIADDHHLVIEGVRLKLAELGPDSEFVVATTVDELYKVLRESPPPDLALIDLAMPGAKGFEHITEALRMQPKMRVLILSGNEDGSLMHKLIDSGAHGYIPKSYSPDVMLSAIRLVLSGGIYIPPMALRNGSPGSGYGASGLGTDASDDNEEQLAELLTERQIDVLKLLSRGSPNKVIARELGISEGTVKIHLAAIFRALNVRNRVEAVVASQHLGQH
jgi:DNA-binding NarL/FixJ family response regulator